MRTRIVGDLILPDRVVSKGALWIEGDRIARIATDSRSPEPAALGEHIVEHPGYVAPGSVDLHVHGGDGSDFMDGTLEDFERAIAAHTRHGTTSIVPTTTVASHDRLLRMLETCQIWMAQPRPGARVLGAHFYGPYFGAQAAGCHPTRHLRNPEPSEYQRYLDLEGVLASATVAPELPGAEGFARACHARGIVVNVGHSHATFEQLEAALEWPIQHVDHLFCAMSDRARLRQSQTYPMRGGVLEATLFFDQLTTEVIADGKHLTDELLRLAYKIKGPDRLALVTDCNRALDRPDGDYIFGPRDDGEPIVRRDGVGIMPDGNSLASGVMGMDHMIRTFRRQVKCPLPELFRMSALTPARVVGRDRDIGSLEPGKFADLVLLDADLEVQSVYVSGVVVHER